MDSKELQAKMREVWEKVSREPQRPMIIPITEGNAALVAEFLEKYPDAAEVIHAPAQ